VQRIDHAVGAAQPPGRQRRLDGGKSGIAVAARGCGVAHFGNAL
jgi:hypothetical protein